MLKLEKNYVSKKVIKLKQVMKKDKNISKIRSIDQLEFQIVPIQISFSKKQSSMFYIYFEKGAQVLGKVEQLINGQVATHRFHDGHSMSFKVANQRNLKYQWSLYRWSQEEQEEYLQTSIFTIKDQYQKYIQELQRVQNDLYRIFNEKQKRTEIQQIWNDLRHDLTKSEFQISCSFLKQNSKITFKIKILCDLDKRHEKWKQQKDKKKTVKSISSSRKLSVDSRNISSSELPQLPQTQSKQKVSQFNESQISHQKQSSDNHKNNQVKQFQTDKNKEKEEGIQKLVQSQIRITDPDGTDVTDQIPQNLLTHKTTLSNDYYVRKKSSILSDIIEESNQGSSNVFTKSIQGEKINSLDQIHQEEEPPLFSPLIKTQTYDSLTDQNHLRYIKRTSTLVHKSSQQFDVSQTPKINEQKSTYNFSSYFFKTPSSGYQSSTKSPSNFQIQKTGNKCDSPKTLEHQSEIIQDFGQARNHTIKNLIKIVVIVILLMIIINNLHLFEVKDNRINRKKGMKDLNRIQEDSFKKEKNIKQKNSKKQID